MTSPAAAAEAPRAVDNENPWPGLAAFEEGDRDFFKGREQEIAGLLRRIAREDLTLLSGLSGLGKTSLLRAGLFPRLRDAGVFPVYVRLRYTGAAAETQRAGGPATPPARLVQQCFDAIRHAANQWQYETPPPAASGSMWEYARRRTERFWGPDDRLVTPLLVFDQFEEVFVHDRGDVFSTKAVEEFFQDLSDAITGSPPAWLVDVAGAREVPSVDYLYQPGVFKVLLSFREDYLAQVAGLRSLVRAIDSSHFRLEAMSVEQALTVVAGAGGHLMDDSSPGERDAICRRIVERVAPASHRGPATVDPALLSLFCRELNETRRLQGKRVIDRAIVESGAASQIISGFYDAGMGEVGEATRRFVEERLVLSDSRSRDSVAEETALQSGVTHRDLDFLIDKRILRREEARRGLPRLELTHDVLVEPALAARARRELEEQRLSEERERHEKAERQAQELALLQERIALAEQLTQARDKAEQEARARREADQKREAADKARLEEDLERAQAGVRAARKRIVYAALSASAVVVMTLMAMTQFQQSLEHKVQRLSQAANALLTVDPQLSTMLGVRAVAEAESLGGQPLSVAKAVLIRSVREASHFVAKSRWRGQSLVMSPDGARLGLVGDGGEAVEVRDGDSFQHVAASIRASQGKRIVAVHFLGDGAGILLVSADASFERIDDIAKPDARFLGRAPGTGEPPRSDGPPPALLDQAFDRDRGHLLVSTLAPEYLSGDMQEVGTPRWRLSIADTGTGTWRDVSVESPDVSEVALSDAGTYYATVTRAGLATLKDAGGREITRRKFNAGDTVRVNRRGSHVLAYGRLSVSAAVWALERNETWTIGLPGRADVRAAWFSPDGRSLAVLQASGIAQVWDVDTRRPLLEAPVAAQGLTFSPDSKEVLIWDERNVAVLSRPASAGGELRLAGHHDAIVAAAIAPARASIVTMSASETIVWSRAPVDRIIERRPEGRVRVVALSPDGASVASANGPLLRIALGVGEETEAEMPAEVLALAYSADGRTLAVALASGEIRFRSLVAGDSPRRPVEDRRGPVTAVAFGKSTATIAYAVAGRENIAVLRDLESERAAEQSAPGRIVAIAVSEDGQRCAFGVGASSPYGGSLAEGPGTNVSFHTFDRNDRRLAVAPAELAAHQEPPAGALPPPPLDFRPDTSAVVAATAGIGSNRDFGFAVSTNEARQITPWVGLRPQPPLRFDEEVRVVAVSPGGRDFAAGGRNGLTRLYLADNLADPVTLREQGAAVTALAFSHDGEHLACARDDGSVTVYGFGTNALLEKAKEIIAKRSLTDEERAALGDLSWSDGPPSWRDRLESLVKRLVIR